MTNIIQDIHLKRRDFKDSGYLTLSNASLTSGSIFSPIFDDRFEPYDDVLIINLDTANDLEVTVNFNQVQICPYGDKLQINQVVQDIRIKNLGSSTISANNIKVLYRNTGYRGKDLLNKGSKVLLALSNLRSFI